MYAASGIRGRILLILMAVDPGGVTGWAKFDVDEEAVADGEKVADCVTAFAWGQVPVLGGSGTSAEVGSFSETAAEERVARYLFDLAFGGASGGIVVEQTGRRRHGGVVAGGSGRVVGKEADAVVFEDFILREATMGRSLLLPVRMTSAFRGMTLVNAPGILEDEILLRRGSIPRWSIQSPSDGKSVVTNARLKDWGYWIKGKEHARDAIRHGLLWILKHQGKF